MLLGLLVNGVGVLGGEGRLFIAVSKHLKASGPAPAPQDLHGPRLELHVVIHLSIPSEDNPVGKCRHVYLLQMGMRPSVQR